MFTKFPLHSPVELLYVGGHPFFVKYRHFGNFLREKIIQVTSEPVVEYFKLCINIFVTEYFIPWIFCQFLTALYLMSSLGANRTTLWSLSLPILSGSTCSGGRVVGGWYIVCRSVNIISRVADFLVGTDHICLRAP